MHDLVHCLYLSHACTSMQDITSSLFLQFPVRESNVPEYPELYNAYSDPRVVSQNLAHCRISSWHS